jgi:cytochrome c oxidase subunit II
MTGRKLVGLLFGLLCSFLVGCSSVGVTTSSVFNPASPNARATVQLFNFVYIIEAVFFVIVEVGLVYAMLRFSRNQGKGLPKQVYGNAFLVITWTVIPAIFLGIIFFVSLSTLNTVMSTPPQSSLTGAPLQVKVIGHQWFWEFDYPAENIVTANEMVVPVGTLVNLDIQSIDVIHSYWVPELGGKIDAIPGVTNQIHFQVDKTGTFVGQCAEFCGADHAQMRMTVVVKSPADYAAWVKGQQAPIPTLSGDAASGEQFFVEMPCLACHTVNGTKAQGKVGPDLTHFASRSVFAGGVLPNTPDNLTKWLADPQAVKPGNLMPNLGLGPGGIKLLLAFLYILK